jgi:hypothetical protein
MLLEEIRIKCCLNVANLYKPVPTNENKPPEKENPAPSARRHVVSPRGLRRQFWLDEDYYYPWFWLWHALEVARTWMAVTS